MDGKLATLGVGPETIAVGTVLFIMGAILASLAIWVSTNHFVEVTGDEAKNLQAARHKKALFDGLASEAMHGKIEEALEAPAREMGDFKFSKWDIYLTNASGSMWLAGTLAILIDLVAEVTSDYCA